MSQRDSNVHIGAQAARGAGSQQRRPTSTATLDFPPVPNGVDYLRSAVEHLKGEPTPRDLKYAVLHLQAGAEVLIKAKLYEEHWTLVFRDPGKATTKSLNESDFDSCTMAAAIERLRHIANVQISEKEAKALRDLTKDRNALQHFGLTHSARAVAARAALVLDFLVHFAWHSLIPGLNLPEHERERIWSEMGEVRSGLTSIQQFVDERMKRLRATVLKNTTDHTLVCPNCGQPALLATDNHITCHFCDTLWPPEDLAAKFVEDPEGPWHDCPECGYSTLIPGTLFVKPPDEGVLHCLNCAARFRMEALTHCTGCGAPWLIEKAVGGQTDLCPECCDRIRREEDERYWQ